jgi:hypothetical protein
MLYVTEPRQAEEWLRLLQDDGFRRRRLAIEEPIAVALYEGIMRPRVSLDTVGVVFLSDQPLATSATSAEMVEDD